MIAARVTLFNLRPNRYLDNVTPTVILLSTPVSLAEVKAHRSELVSRVHRRHERVTVTVHGRPSAVLLSVEDLESPGVKP